MSLLVHITANHLCDGYTTDYTLGTVAFWSLCRKALHRPWMEGSHECDTWTVERLRTTHSKQQNIISDLQREAVSKQISSFRTVAPHLYTFHEKALKVFLQTARLNGSASREDASSCLTVHSHATQKEFTTARVENTVSNPNSKGTEIGKSLSILEHRQDIASVRTCVCECVRQSPSTIKGRFLSSLYSLQCFPPLKNYFSLHLYFL